MHNMRWGVAWWNKHFARTLTPDHCVKARRAKAIADSYQAQDKKLRNERIMKRAKQAR